MGQVITFYSYKGGTGRSFLLANVAWILASNGKRVLMVDWDLEAPGLHRYFHPFLTDEYLTASPGMIDWVLDYQSVVTRLDAATTTVPPEVLQQLADPAPYIVELNVETFDFAGFGKLHFLPAGQQDAEYADRVNRYNWLQLYDNLGGAKFFAAARAQMVSLYDYVLIDSRTGASDTAGISTLAMPDKLVICFTLNSQSVLGASGIARIACERRSDRSTECEVFPVATRVDRSEKLKLQVARQSARDAFKGLPRHLESAEAERYWGQVEVPYESFYSYEEVLAVFGDEPGEMTSVLSASERLTTFLTGTVTHLGHIDEAVRKEVLGHYLRGGTGALKIGQTAEQVFLQLEPELHSLARATFLRFVHAAPYGVPAVSAVAVDLLPAAAGPLLARFASEGVILRSSNASDRQMAELADPRLTSSWPRLARWIEKDFPFIQWRTDLQARIAAWATGVRNPKLLLPEPLLETAVTWQTQRAAELTDAERSYITESERHWAEARSAEERSRLEAAGSVSSPASDSTTAQSAAAAAPYDRVKILVRVRPSGGDDEGVGESVTARTAAYYSVPPLSSSQVYVPAGQAAGLPSSEKDSDSPAIIGIGFAQSEWPTPTDRSDEGSRGQILDASKQWTRSVSSQLNDLLAAKGEELPRREQQRLIALADQAIAAALKWDGLKSFFNILGTFRLYWHRLIVDVLRSVRIVSDFERHRDILVRSVDRSMAEALRVGPAGASELYVIAHGESSVMMFVALLSALAEPELHPWIRSVRGIMTIGSPIELYHLLWPKLWRYRPGPVPLKAHPAAPRIPWHNYLEHGDPNGYPLTRTSAWMNGESGFGKCLQLWEHSFSRSYRPSRAHTDYWRDESVFGHFFETVVKPPVPEEQRRKPQGRTSQEPKFSEPPRTRPYPQLVSWTLPYAVVLVLLVSATYILYAPFVEMTVVRKSPAEIVLDVAGISALFAGILTVMRLPRLANNWRFHIGAVAVLLVSSTAFVNLLELSPRSSGSGLVAAYAAVLAFVTGVAARRWAPKGNRIVLFVGVVNAILLVRVLLEPYSQKSDIPQSSIWLALLGVAGFSLLWQLAGLVFDLAFVWHRYVRFEGLIRGLSRLLIADSPPASQGVR